jgi:hypothetical protein
MVERRSLSNLLDDLEGQAGKLRQAVAAHTQKEEHHREQRRTLGERLEALEERLGRFRDAATAVLEMAEPPRDPAPAATADFGSPASPKLARMVDHVLAVRPDATPFGATEISREVNRLFRDRLRRGTDGRQISVVLRRYCDQGELRLARPGRPYSEGLYTVA